MAELPKVVFRWIVGLSFFGLAFWAATTGYESKQYGLMFFSLPLFFVGLAAIWKMLFSAVSAPFVALIKSIYLPGGKLEKPVLNLKLPAYYFNEGRYSEAFEEYQKVIKHYPDETEAYERLIWLHVEIFDEISEAKKLVRKAKRRNLVLDNRIILAVERS